MKAKENSFWKPVNVKTVKTGITKPLFKFSKSVPPTSPRRVNLGNANSKPVHAININANVPKKEMNWFQAKTKHPKLSPFKDADRDGIINSLDCKPFDRMRQGETALEPKNKKKIKNKNKIITYKPFYEEQIEQSHKPFYEGQTQQWNQKRDSTSNQESNGISDRRDPSDLQNRFIKVIEEGVQRGLERGIQKGLERGPQNITIKMPGIPRQKISEETKATRKLAHEEKVAERQIMRKKEISKREIGVEKEKTHRALVKAALKPKTVVTIKEKRYNPLKTIEPIIKEIKERENVRVKELKQEKLRDRTISYKELKGGLSPTQKGKLIQSFKEEREVSDSTPVLEKDIVVKFGTTALTGNRFLAAPKSTFKKIKEKVTGKKRGEIYSDDVYIEKKGHIKKIYESPTQPYIDKYRKEVNKMEIKRMKDYEKAKYYDKEDAKEEREKLKEMSAEKLVDAAERKEERKITRAEDKEVKREAKEEKILEEVAKKMEKEESIKEKSAQDLIDEA